MPAEPELTQLNQARRHMGLEPQLEAQLEAHLGARRFAEARALRAQIDRALPKAGVDPWVSLARASRRLGDLDEAERCLSIAARGFRRGSPRPLAWVKEAILVLSSLGAFRFPRRLLAEIGPTELSAAERALLLSYCHLADEARAEFERGGLTELTMRERLGYGFALCAAARYADAAAVLAPLHEAQNSYTPPVYPQIAVCLATCAYFLGDLGRCRAYLDEADRVLGADADSPSRGEYWVWRAALDLAEGQNERAELELSRATAILARPGRRAETAFAAYYWQGELRARREGGLPVEWRRMLAYPSPDETFRRLIRARTGSADEHFEFRLRADTAGIEGASENIIDLNSDTVRRVGDARPRIGLSLAEEALAWLIIAGEWGIAESRLEDTLWDDSSSGQRLKRLRLSQILSRLRRAGVTIVWRNGHLTCEGAPGWSVVYCPREPRLSGSCFLSQRPDFSRAEVEAYFGTSASSAKRLIQRWRDAYRVRAEGSRYRVLPGRNGSCIG